MIQKISETPSLRNLVEIHDGAAVISPVGKRKSRDFFGHCAFGRAVHHQDSAVCEQGAFSALRHELLVEFVWKRRVEENVVEAALATFHEKFHGHEMASDFHAHFPFGERDVFKDCLDFEPVLFAKLDIRRSPGNGFNRDCAGARKKVEPRLSVQVAENREYGFAHLVHRGANHAVRTFYDSAFQLAAGYPHFISPNCSATKKRRFAEGSDFAWQNNTHPFCPP